MTLALIAAATPWTLIVGGDVMLNQVKPSANVFKGITKVVSDADLAYANLEIPITSVTKPTTRKTAAEIRARTQYILRADPGHMQHFKNAGFDTVSLANNHAMDYNWAGLKDFIARMDKVNIAWFGAGKNWEEARKLQIHEVGGIKVGFLSYLSFNNPSSMRKCTPATTNGPGVATITITGWPDDRANAHVKGIVQKAKAACDLLIVCLHWGIEKQTQPAPNQVRLGRMFVDHGADMIVGAHPHVLQPSELYKGKPIMYSLGNLVSPRPGSTALYRFRYEGSTLKGVDYFPASISGGRVSVKSNEPSKPAAAVQAEKTLLRRYPSKQSKGLIGG